jgi:hypothetical protein
MNFCGITVESLDETHYSCRSWRLSSGIGRSAGDVKICAATLRIYLCASGAGGLTSRKAAPDASKDGKRRTCPRTAANRLGRVGGGAHVNAHFVEQPQTDWYTLLL